MKYFPFKINDVVVVAERGERSVPSKKAERGTVIYVFSEPDEAYEVEFCDDSGRPIATKVYSGERLRLWKSP